MDCSTPGLPVHHQLPEFTQTYVHWVGDAIQSSHPLSSPSSRLQSFSTSGSFPVSQFFTSGSQSIGVSASPSVLPVNIQDWFSFRIDWFELLAIQGILKNLLQHHSSKASVLWHSVFFIVQLSGIHTFIHTYIYMYIYEVCMLICSATLIIYTAHILIIFSYIEILII